MKKTNEMKKTSKQRETVEWGVNKLDIEARLRSLSGTIALSKVRRISESNEVEF